jgi:hypothetical protein
MEFLKSLDREVISLSDAEAARWQKAVAPVVVSAATKNDGKNC